MPYLYLIPTFLAEDSAQHMPQIIELSCAPLRTFVVERTRTARRFLRSIISDFPIDESSFLELDKHDIQTSMSQIKSLLKEKKDIGLMSEAGTPCIADPGAKVVHLARQAGYTIRPLTGPNSIILALMASGLNGQQFSFHGYLPIDDHKLSSKLKDISRQVTKNGSTHICIETPYRNQKLLKNIIKHVNSSLQLTIAKDLNGANEWIDTRPLQKWKDVQLDKTPAIFCIGKL